ncbi:hypothetical protein Cgig2_033919 [Carnegiea gigantea]|uniref:Uncharacterized protein n=1 Tax=Carnegiea gigantea TaxID=171969 RepID=A0A9Q1JS25_9CARY|nr:hypothetical protein Cgig2_033919 [Carnegiea gigantea]
METMDSALNKENEVERAKCPRLYVYLLERDKEGSESTQKQMSEENKPYLKQLNIFTEKPTVLRAMEAANSAKPLPHFDYIPTHGGEPSHQPEWVPFSRYTEREISQSNLSGRPYTEQLGRRAAVRPSGCPTHGAPAKPITASTPYATHSRQTA